MDIVIDFDGTVVTHEYPEIGKDIGAESILKELVTNGHRLILFTMRSDNFEKDNSSINGRTKNTRNYLTEAVSWFNEREIPLFGIQINPEQVEWTTSPKAHGQLIIDDSALGCPVTNYSKELNVIDNYKPFVDWIKVRKLLVEMGLLN